jgi:hypothetical protein
MEPPPEFLDGTRVLQFATPRHSPPTGRTRHVVDGAEASRFAAVAIARYDGASTAHLFYCDPQWHVVTDTEHEDVASAIRQANFELGLLRFRELAGFE